MGCSSDLIVVVEHESLLLPRPEAEAGVEVVPEAGNVCQSQVQVALTREMSLTGHLQEHNHTAGQTYCIIVCVCVFIPCYVIILVTGLRECHVEILLFALSHKFRNFIFGCYKIFPEPE